MAWRRAVILTIAFQMAHWRCKFYFSKDGLRPICLFPGDTQCRYFSKNFLLKQPLFRFNDVKWSQDLSAENFSFSPVEFAQLIN